MDGMQDVLKVNQMISELKRHNMGLAYDDAYAQAQTMLLGKSLTTQSDLTAGERELRNMGLKVDTLYGEIRDVREQIKVLGQQLQDAVRTMSTQRVAAPSQPVQQAPREAPREERQQRLEPAAKKPSFDPSVENIFYFGTKR